MQIPDTVQLADAAVDTLPRHLVPVYDSWRFGRDLSAIYAKATFYLYRNALLPYGIDIAHIRPRAVVLADETLAGTPLKAFLDGPGVAPPAWAAGLIAA